MDTTLLHCYKFNSFHPVPPWGPWCMIVVPDAWSFHVRTPSRFQYMGDGMVLLGPRSWRVNLNLQWGCFDSWANYQLSASLKAKKARQVEISLLITAQRGGSNKRRRWEQLMVDCFHLSSRRRRPCKFGHHPHQTQFQGDYWEFYCRHLVTRRSTAGVYLLYMTHIFQLWMLLCFS